jgi:allantoate deiminase
MSAAYAMGTTAPALPSGAGHDAVTMADAVPVGMMFVRCKGGISHNPAETVDVDDVAAAIRALDNILDQLAEQARQDAAKEAQA